MLSLSTRWVVATALLALAVPQAFAQGAAAVPSLSPSPSSPPKPPDPLNADAVVPAVSAPRTFDGYRAWRDTGVAPWRETNAAVSPKPDAASGHGGHAGHVMSVMPASAPAASPTPPAGEPMPGMHHH